MRASFRTVDDRGAGVRVPHAHVLMVGRWWLTRRRRPSWRGAWRVFVALFITGPVLAIVFGIALVAIGVRVAMDDPSAGLWMLIFSPVYTAMFMLVFTLGRGLMGFGGAVPEIVRVEMLARMRCPACGYGLAGAAAETDGCVRCAECGSAWEHRRLGVEDQGPDVVVVDWGESDR